MAMFSFRWWRLARRSATAIHSLRAKQGRTSCTSIHNSQTPCGPGNSAIGPTNHGSRIAVMSGSAQHPFVLASSRATPYNQLHRHEAKKRSMEKIKKHQRTELPPAELYLDDLAEIAELAASESKKLEISAGEYKTSEISELGKLAEQFPSGKFDYIKITSYEPFFVISLNKERGGDVTLYDTSLALHGLASKVEKLFNQRKKVRLYWPITLAGLFLLTSGAYVLSSTEPASTWGLVMMLVGAGLYYLVPRHFKAKMILHCKKRAEVKGFYEKNRDTIWATVIGGIVAGGLVAAATPFINSLAAKAGAGG